MLVYQNAVPEYIRPVDALNLTDAEKAHPAKWSNKQGEPAAIGSVIHVRINGIGRAKVLHYFIEYGWLGLYCEAEKPPAWMLKQNGNGRCHIYGAEYDAI